MTDQTVKVRKTKYRGKKVSAKDRENSATPEREHYTKRTLADFPAPRRDTDGTHEIDASVRLLAAVYRSGLEFGREGEFALAIPGEYGTYKGCDMRGCQIKLLHGTAYLPDNGKRFEWL